MVAGGEGASEIIDSVTSIPAPSQKIGVAFPLSPVDTDDHFPPKE